MKRSWHSLAMSLIMIMVWTSCSDDTLDNAGLSEDAAGKKGNPKAQSAAGDYNVSISNNGYVFTYTITKNEGAKDLGHFIIDLNNCGDESAHLASVLYASVKADDADAYEIDLQDSEGWGTGCSPSSLNFIKFDDLPKASVLQLSFELDMKYDVATSQGWLKSGISCNAAEIQAPGCPIVDCLFGLGTYFSKGAADWESDVDLGGFTYNQAEGKALWYGGNDNNVALKAFFRYASVVLNGALENAPAAAIEAIEVYFEANENKLTHGNINAGLFPSTPELATALNTLNEWIAENDCN
jgi:hypothetical protein